MAHFVRAAVEIGLSTEPANLVLELLRNIRADIARLDEKAATKAELRSQVADLRSELQSLRADVASDFIGVNAKMETLRNETSEQIAGLRRAVVEYHSAVLGHGVLISGLEARVRRMEQHVGLPGMGSE